MKLAPSYIELLGSDIVFLMELEWNGQIFRFSTLPIEIEKDDGTTISFQGAIDDPDFRLESSVLGFNAESNSIPMEVYFDGINVSQQRFQGNLLDESPCEISYVLVREFQPVHTYEQRIIMMKGKVTQPIFGHVDQPVGYVAFSIENETDDQIIQIVDPEKKISYETFVDPHDSTAIGKVYPFIIGEPGNQIPQTTSSGGIFNADIYCTPAYLNNEQNTVGGVFELMVAGHPVEAASVEVVDFAHNTASIAISQSFDLLGNELSVITTSTAIEGNQSTSENAGNPYYWIRWTNGGGHPNPFGDGALEKGGDLLLFLLMKTKANIDFPSFDSIREYLNVYKFSGYINTDITVQQFIQSNMIPFLPLEIVNGPNGLRPIIPMIFRNNPSSLFDFQVDDNCRLISPIEPSISSDEIINEITLKYGYSGFFDKYLGYYTIKESEYTTISKNRFGVRKQEIELEFVTDFATVQRIGANILRQRALGYFTVDIQADFEYGYLYLGDVVTLTSIIHGMNRIKCQIIAKEYQDKQWMYTLMIEDNPIVNNRTIL